MLNKTQLFFDLFVVIILIRPLFYFDRNRSTTTVTTNAFSIVTYPNRHHTKSILLFSAIPTEPINNDIQYKYDRAHYCADNFGSCTLAEMESIINELHQDRLQNLILSDGYDPFFQSSLTLEEELDAQVTAIKEQNVIMDMGSVFPKDAKEDKVLSQLDAQVTVIKEQNVIMDMGSVFPKDAKEDEVLSHLHDNEQSVGIFHKPTPTEVLVFEETILEENLLEPIAICCIILGMALIPQFI